MSSEIKVEHKAVVIPGQVLANGMDYLPGEETYRDGDAIRAKILGLANVSGRVMKVTALSGPYMPKVGDTIIGKVSDILMSGWRVQTGTPYSAMLNVRDATQRFVRKGEDLSKILEIGDYVVAKITNVTAQNLIDLTMKEPGLFRIRNGRIIQVAAQKVPRIIGKRGSMISLLKRYTGCKVVVGQNGSVLLDGAVEKEALATKVIRMIEELAHQSGLTEKIEAHLKSVVGEVPEAPAHSENRDNRDNRNSSAAPSRGFQRDQHVPADKAADKPAEKAPEAKDAEKPAASTEAPASQE